MKLNRWVMLTMSCTALAACDVDLLTSVEETTEALETAQTDFCAFRAQADACRQTFDGCVLAAGADTEACRTALHDCLPPPPPRPEGHCAGRGDGGLRPPPPPGGDGGLPPPPGGRHHRGPGPGPRPEPAAVIACRDALAACLAATPGDVTCLETERACVRDAFRAAFDAACADAATTCASLPAEASGPMEQRGDQACTRLTTRCAEGIDGRVDGDGGVCVAPPEVLP